MSVRRDRRRERKIILDASFEQEEQLLAQRSSPFVSGTDECGRGCLAGPVVVGTVSIPEGIKRPNGVRDSKKLTEHRREVLFEALRAVEGLEYTVVFRSPGEIDEMNILNATLSAMTESILSLKQQPHHVLIDGTSRPRGLEHYYVHLIPKGDQECWVIAAASIIAKVTRDRLMRQLSQIPAYLPFRFEQNKGYGTAIHMAALSTMGPTDIHRRSFRPVQKLLKEEK